MDDKDWWDVEVVEGMVLKLQAKELIIPGVTVVDEMPPSLVEAPPAKPKLLRSVWLPPKNDSIMPGAMLNEQDEKLWLQDQVRAAEFRKVQDDFDQEFGKFGVKPSAPVNKSEDSDPAPVGPGAEPPVKKPKTTNISFKKLEELEGDVLHECKISTIKTAKELLIMQSRTGSRQCLVNPGQDAVSVPVATLLVGFGKIKFRQLKGDSAPYDEALDYTFAPSGSADKVMIDNVMTTYGEAVSQYAKAKTSEMAKVCYHTIEREPGNDVVFKLKQDFQVVMRAQDTAQQGTVTGASFAAFVPLRLWKLADAEWYEIVWVCKWVNTGLIPVRAVVVAKATFTLPGLHAIEF